MDYDNKFNLEYINDTVKTLIINIKSLLIPPIQEKTKLFLILFRTIQHKETINTVTDLTD